MKDDNKTKRQLVDDLTELRLQNAEEISAEHAAEDALQESEDRYRLLFEGAQDGMALTDLETGKLMDCNPALCRMVEKDKNELLGQPQRILHPQQTLINGYSSSYRLQKIDDPAQTLEDNLLSKSGKIIPVEIRASKIRLDNRDYLLGIFRDITERKQAEETLKQSLENLRNAVNATIQVIISTVETRDPYTANHQLRVANLARAIATEMELSLDRIEGVWLGGSIHDLGKLSIPAEILSKPGKISENEFSLIKEHPRKGYEILKNVESSWPLSEIVYQHHERMDGSGYPRNLKGNAVLMEARILGVSDVIEAMASHRPYRAALGIDAALKEIEDKKGILYDTDVVDICLRLFNEKGYQLESA